MNNQSAQSRQKKVENHEDFSMQFNEIKEEIMNKTLNKLSEPLKEAKLNEAFNVCKNSRIPFTEVGDCMNNYISPLVEKYSYIVNQAMTSRYNSLIKCYHSCFSHQKFDIKAFTHDQSECAFTCLETNEKELISDLKNILK